MSPLETAMRKCVAEIADARRLQAFAIHRKSPQSWQNLLDCRGLWAVREDVDYSFRHMDSAEQVASIIEDLCTVHRFWLKGVPAKYHERQAYRYVGRDQELAVMAALCGALDTGLIECYDGECFRVIDDRYEEAQDFIGIMYDESEGVDIFDSLMSVGGEELAVDSFVDIGSAINEGE